MATDQTTAAAETAESKRSATAERLKLRSETTPRSRIRRHAERSAASEAQRILEAGRIAHVAYALDGQPHVIPFLYDYADGALYLHGAPGSRTLKSLRAGMQVAVEVLLLDGLIASRDAESHSANYRSVVVYGVAQRVTHMAEKRAILERMTGRYFPGRAIETDYAPATEKQMRALEVLRVPVDELSAKMREGGPRGPRDADPSDASGHTAFVVEIGGRDM
ncbi:MAG TPA: pyridoxamine 5'-phosphate oxidase family protein [Ktedonobacterales bacterium]|jgi:nitroimidazol reductase NimA-like FMN-containing flavoprotein (pyridoxamine 5'-phosphate oxidase superfamily)|nr:pyridoxamine 5'-phosphate oxidase family protein [Ktedonobacterales bacterium]